MEKKFINPYVLSIVQVQKTKVAARAAGAGGGPARQQNRAPKVKTVTVVVYEKKRVKTVVVYIGREVFTFKVPAYREIRGVVKKTWTVGRTKAYSMRVRAKDVVELIDAYAHDKAVRKIYFLDPVYRAAVLQGYKVHDNELYVKLWLEHKLGEPLFHTGDPREKELGDCLKHFTHSYGVWRMVTPPWAAKC